MKIIRILVEPEQWLVKTDTGDTYVLKKEEVIRLDGPKYAELLDYLGTITVYLETNETELLANGFLKRLI